MQRTPEENPGQTGVEFLSGASGHRRSNQANHPESSWPESSWPESSWKETFRELSLSTVALLKSDLELAASEIRLAGKNAQRHALQLGIFGAIAAIGLLPFVAFLVIGLGELINNYWLSALVVSLFCFGIGGIFAYRAWVNIREQDFSMTETRRMLDRQFHAIERKLKDISAKPGRRAA